MCSRGSRPEQGGISRAILARTSTMCGAGSAMERGSISWGHECIGQIVYCQVLFDNGRRAVWWGRGWAGCLLRRPTRFVLLTEVVAHANFVFYPDGTRSVVESPGFDSLHGLCQLGMAQRNSTASSVAMSSTGKLHIRLRSCLGTDFDDSVVASCVVVAPGRIVMTGSSGEVCQGGGWLQGSANFSVPFFGEACSICARISRDASSIRAQSWL